MSNKEAQYNKESASLNMTQWSLKMYFMANVMYSFKAVVVFEYKVLSFLINIPRCPILLLITNT